LVENRTATLVILTLKLALQVFAVVAALLTTTLDYGTHDKRTRWFKRLRRLLYCVAVLSLLLGLVITVNDEIAKREEIASLKGELTAIRDGVHRMTDAVTGGESLPYVNIVGGRVMLINEGSTPLYDISLRMWDPSDYADVKSSTEFWALEPQVLKLAIPNMAPNIAQEVAQIQLPAKPVKTFQISINARNGIFTEQLVMRQVDNMWRTAYRVFRGAEQSPSARVLERVDRMFPRNAQGEPQWDNL